MFQHLLVPVDFAHAEDAAVRVAHDMAASSPARITLMHVVETIDQTAGEEFQPFYDLLLEKSMAKLAELAEPLQRAGVAVETQVAIGKPLAELVRASMEQSVDLVVLRSHRIELDRSAAGWGTLSYQLSVLCPCPVLLVK